MGFEWRIFFPISKEVFNAASTKHEPALHLSSQTDYLKHVHNSKLTTNLSGCEQRIDQYYVLRNINLGLKVRCALDSLPKSTTALVPDSLLELKVRSDKDKTLAFKKWNKVIAKTVTQKTLLEELTHLNKKGNIDAALCLSDLTEQGRTPVIASVSKRRWKLHDSEQTDMMIQIVEDENSSQLDNLSQASKITGPFYYRSVCVEGSYNSVESFIKSDAFAKYLNQLHEVFSNFQTAEGEKSYCTLAPMDYPEFLLNLCLFHGVKV